MHTCLCVCLCVYVSVAGNDSEGLLVKKRTAEHRSRPAVLLSAGPWAGGPGPGEPALCPGLGRLGVPPGSFTAQEQPVGSKAPVPGSDGCGQVLSLSQGPRWHTLAASSGGQMGPLCMYHSCLLSLRKAENEHITLCLQRSP